MKAVPSGAAPATSAPRLVVDTDEMAKLAPFLAALVATAAALRYVLSQAPLPPASCDDVSVAWMVKGSLPDAMGGRGDVLGTVKSLKVCVSEYDRLHPTWTLIVYSSVYVALQAFAIPGPLILSILSGALWSYPKSQVLIAACATSGAGLCYGLSNALSLGTFAAKLAPEKYQAFVDKVQSGTSLYPYLMFLRLTPLLPNWLINLAAPVAGVPLVPFLIATAVGQFPANTLHWLTGSNLAMLEGGDDFMKRNKFNFAIMFCVQFLALLPTLFKSKLERVADSQFASSSSKKTE